MCTWVQSPFLHTFSLTPQFLLKVSYLRSKAGKSYTNPYILDPRLLRFMVYPLCWFQTSRLSLTWEKPLFFVLHMICSSAIHFSFLAAFFGFRFWKCRRCWCLQKDGIDTFERISQWDEEVDVSWEFYGELLFWYLREG